jgi:hypothetical protein
MISSFVIYLKSRFLRILPIRYAASNLEPKATATTAATTAAAAATAIYILLIREYPLY